MTANEQPDGGGDLSRRVRRRRSVLGLTREEVAARARMDSGYLARVEHAPVALTTSTLIRLADALDTTVAELLGAIPEQPPGHGRAALRAVLAELSEQECLRLIEPGGIGRVAFEEFRDLAMGSVSAHVATHAACPAVVVPPRWESGRRRAGSSSVSTAPSAHSRRSSSPSSRQSPDRRR